MALAAMLRRSASVVPLAIRAVGRQRQVHSSALSAAIKHSCGSRQIYRSSFPSVRHYSSRPSSDASLLKVIESEIQCAEETDEQVEEIPDGFPFELEDNPGLQTITLKRDYQGETITVVVHMSSLVTGENDEDDDNDDSDSSNQSSIPLVVSVKKKRGGPVLEFTCTAFPDEISIDDLSVKDLETPEEQIAYEGPEFSDLDENLQKAFQKYLEIRGIKPSALNFLHTYMIDKDNREYKQWLKNLKGFIEA